MVRGSCLCGSVRYEVKGRLPRIVHCHCRMCRKAHGHIGAYAAVAKDALRLVEARGLKWYRSSTHARRGFCSEWGSTLFWDGEGRDTISIADSAISNRLH